MSAASPSFGLASQRRIAAASGGSAVSARWEKRGARGLVQHRREAMMLEPLERVGERVDRIVGARARAVAAGVGRGQDVALIGLLGGLDAEAEQGAVLEEGAAAGIGVEREIERRGVDPLAGGELGAAPARLLVAGEQDDDVAIGPEALGAQAQQGGGDGDHALLVVERAAAVEIAALLAERERVARPILAARLDHVHMGHEQDRLAARRPRRRPAQDQRGGMIVGADDVIGMDGDARSARRRGTAPADRWRARARGRGPGRSGCAMAWA